MRKYAAYLHSVWFTQRNLARIFKHNTDYKDFFENLRTFDLREFVLDENRIALIMKSYSDFDVSSIDVALSQRKIKIVTIHDDEYPESLRFLHTPPFLLYVRWTLDNSKNLLSIVGSRKNTSYSHTTLRQFIPWLLRAGFSIVSWGAYWVDSIAHNLTLDNGWYTISVIWTGIDIDYPRINAVLYDKIIERWWAVLSVFRLWTLWERHNFPIRNEIIAWISKWTLITEAADKSWTLITARLALELNRDVFVVPGDISRESSLWTNSLLRDWLAKAVITYEDILIEYDLNSRSEDAKITQLSFEDPIEQGIHELLRENPLDASYITDKLNSDIRTISCKISMMEVNWIVRLWNWWLYHLNQ
ncbi:MAG: hypothetical protein ACD_3C00145G0006 [uncultured bacterium (gcode 4)]|uniref:Smf/DprA SLOG domain-containing protein n=1 Tax=uncultured bacterium (gcode 4) TaxID=1234023 RepID=K2GWT1_9BACT|nr:MAG: hypothetical protein ACD_3C00145G0006 [uncultured bacterium (gcode 4)]